MSNIPHNRPHVLLVDVTAESNGVVIRAPYAILVLAAEEHTDEDAPAPVANSRISEPPPSRPGVARCIPSNVYQLPRRRLA